MNILLKSFDGPENRIAVEEALKDLDLGTVVSLLWDKRQIPDLKAREHIVLNPREFSKTAEYPGVDWNAMLPLDEDLIEKMRPCEGIFMTMITRMSLDDISYAARKRQYYRHLRYWNDLIEKRNIGFMLSNHTPHQCYDFVAYHLCRLKGIPTLLLHRSDALGLAVLTQDYEDFSPPLKDLYDRLRKEYADPSKPIPLSPKMERYYEGQTIRNDSPWNMPPRPSYLMKKNFVAKWSGKVARLLIHKPRTMLALLTSPKVWKRKLREHRTIKFYDAHVGTPDFSVPYVYVPLHMQPEFTTCPIGGAYVDQELVVQLLAACLPEGVRLYVKEHPYQHEVMRSEAFYQSLLDIPSVTLMPRMTNTFELSKHAKAVATVTGTAGFEGLFRGTPAFLFGHTHYQCCAGVHMIRSAEDCRKAVESVFVKHEKPRLRDARLFLKAYEDMSTIYDYAPLGPGETVTLEEQNAVMGRNMGKAIRALLKTQNLCSSQSL